MKEFMFLIISVIYMLYYAVVGISIGFGKFKTKKQFLLALIPFKIWYDWFMDLD